MATEVQRRRGTTTEHSTFTGADGELTVDTTKKTVVVHDGVTAGGVPLAREDLANVDVTPSAITPGTARQLLQTDAAGTGVEWTSNVDIPGTLDVTSAATFDGNVTISGDLTVNGTTTNINTQNLVVEDKNIILGDVTTPSDVTADGGGITLKGATDKTINWVDATDAWTSSERFSVPLGSAASPSLTFTGDENTGIYSPGADQLALSTNGTGRLFIDSSGRVGIGTTSPGRILHVDSGSTSNSYIRFTNTNSTGNGAEVGLFDSGAANPALVLSNTMSDGAVVINTNGLERLRVTETGLVGIGIGTSAAGTLLHLAGNNTGTTGDSPVATIRLEDTDGSTSDDQPIGKIEFYGNDSTTPAVGVQSYIISRAVSTSGGGYLEFGTRPNGGASADPRMRIDGSGRVGIGTQSPVDTVTIQKNTTSAAFGGLTLNTADSNASVLTMGVSSSLDSASIASLRTGTGTVRPLTFIVGTNSANERMRIDTSGRLLVGTASSSQNVSLIAQGSSSGATQRAQALLALGANNPGATATLGILSYSDSGHTPAAWIFAARDGGTWTSGSSQPTRLALSTTADGTNTPVERMVISSTGTTTLTSAASTAPFIANIGASEVARIDSSGRLLVGTFTSRSVGVERSLQIEGTTGATGSASFVRNSNDGGGPSLNLGKTRGATVGSSTVVAVDDTLGTINFQGASGSNLNTAAASISALVDGTPGANDMPGRIVLSTTSDGASAPTERLRIDSAGRLRQFGNTIISNVDVASATYDSISFSVAGQETNPQGLFFSPDGRKMFVTGSIGDDINEYTLSTPWNVSTAAYVTVFSVASQSTDPRALAFRNDGKKLYVSDLTAIYQYSLSTPWSIASASYDSISFSVLTQEVTVTGLSFRPDGLAFYIVGTGSDTVFSYNLTTAWNISTATLADSFSVASQDSTPQDLSFTADGSRMFVLGNAGDDVNIYNLTTPWAIATASFVTSFSVAAQENQPFGLFIKPDGAKFYIVGTASDTVYQYSIPSVTIDLTGTTNINGSAEVAQDLTVRGGVGFYGTAAIAQPAGTGETTGFTASTGTAVNDASTFTGNLGTTAYRINDVVKALKQLGLLKL